MKQRESILHIAFSALSLLASLTGCTRPLPPTEVPKIKKAYEHAREALKDRKFESVLASLGSEDFDHDYDSAEAAHDDGRQVLGKLQDADSTYHQMVTSTKTFALAKAPSHPKTNAYEGSDPGPIVLAKSKLRRLSETDWAGTFVHELAHRAGYSHGENDPEGKECTVPNLVTDLATWTTDPTSSLQGYCPALVRAIEQYSRDSVSDSGPRSPANELVGGRTSLALP